jgi:hypothetical protein
MFCNNCGASAEEGSKFCKNCGSPFPLAPIVASPPGDERESRKKGGGFFSSPAGIALVVIIAIAVLAGVTFGIILLARGNGDNTVDADTVKVWDEYETMLNDNSTNLPKITTDQASLTQAQADLKKTQDRVTALEKALKETGGTEARRNTGKKSTSTRDIKADQMAAALAAYNIYVQKMNELFGTLIGANLLDANVVNKLNQILAELQKLGADVEVLSNKFLADNKNVTTTQVDFPILGVAKTFQADIQNNVTAAQQAEQQRLAAEQAAADQAAAAAEAARQKQAAEQKSQVPRCPICGASDPAVWVEMRGSYKCYNCGYRQEKQ